MPLKVKGKIYRTMVRPAMLYGMETVPLTAGLENRMDAAEMRMLRWSLGVTRRDMLRNEVVRDRLKVGVLSQKIKESRLRWYGHEERRRGLCREESVENGDTRQKEKGTAKTKVDG